MSAAVVVVVIVVVLLLFMAVVSGHDPVAEREAIWRDLDDHMHAWREWQVKRDAERRADSEGEQT